MSNAEGVQRAQQRWYAGQPAVVAMGAAVQNGRIEFETTKNTKLIAFGAMSVCLAVPNSALTVLWLTQIQIIINQTEIIVPTMTRADYVDLVQNPEMKEAAIITPSGEFLYKKFDPPLPPKTKVQILLTFNTLALGVAGAPADTALTVGAIAFDSNKPAARLLDYYIPLNNFPAAVGVVINAPFACDLGNYARKVKAIFLISENPVATAVDTYLGRVELRADGQTVFEMLSPELKKQYAILTDGIAPPAGWHAIACPEGGYQAAANNQIQLRCTPYFTIATAQVRGYEKSQKAW